MAFNLGYKVIHSLCAEQNPMTWQKAKLSPDLFRPHETPAYLWVADHLKKYLALPKLETLSAAFPDFKEIETPEPSKYYLTLLENAYYYERINHANIESQGILKNDQDAYAKAMEKIQEALSDIKGQQYRLKILDVGKEAASMVMSAYYNKGLYDVIHEFGWPYLDEQSGGGQGGDIISYVGRPAAGKTWLALYSALKNWLAGRNVLFVSMEMSPLPIAQRIAAMYALAPIGQLKMAAFSLQTFQTFVKNIKGMRQETGKFYVVDGNLAANVEDIYILADQLGCKNIYIDGAYLVRHKNERLDRFTRVAENVELMKRYTTDTLSCTTASWQFNREASKKATVHGKAGGTVDDIGYSDAIGQISSIVLGMFQEDGIETMLRRDIRMLKGRNGEIGQFGINWLFNTMNFDQCEVDNTEYPYI